MIASELKERLAQEISACREDRARFARAFFGVEPAGPKQQECLNLGGRVQVVVAGRRFGKTLLDTIRVLHMLATRPRTRPARGLVVAPALDQAKQPFLEIEARLAGNPLLQRLAPPENWRWSPFPEVRLRNGSVLMARSTARKGTYIRGQGADVVWVIEAAFVDPEVYRNVIRAVVLDRKGTVILETTPNGRDYVYEIFEQAGKDDTGYYTRFHATSADNPRNDPEELERIRQELPEVVWRVEYLAEFLEDEAAVFPAQVIVQALEDYRPIDEPRPNARYSIGVDLAKYRDYTVIVVLDVTAPPYHLAQWHRYQGVLYSDVIAHVNELAQKFRAPVHIDVTGVGEPVAEQVIGARPYLFTEASRQALVSRLALMFQRGLIRIPASWTPLRDELRFFRYVQKGSRVRPEGTGGYHDDTVFALALAASEAEMERPEENRLAIEALRSAVVYRAPWDENW